MKFQTTFQKCLTQKINSKRVIVRCHINKRKVTPIAKQTKLYARPIKSFFFFPILFEKKIKIKWNVLYRLKLLLHSSLYSHIYTMYNIYIVVSLLGTPRVQYKSRGFSSLFLFIFHLSKTHPALDVISIYLSLSLSLSRIALVPYSSSLVLQPLRPRSSRQRYSPLFLRSVHVVLQ